MPELISKYVSELKTELTTQMNPYEAQLISEEVHSHLLDRFEAYQSLGSDPQTAELEALRAFGSHAAIASGYKKPKMPVLPALKPWPANLLSFVSLLLPIFFVNNPDNRVYMVLLAFWFLIPAVSGLPPLIGLLVGGLITEGYWTVFHHGDFIRDLQYVAQLAVMSLVSWGIGWIIRYAVGFLILKFGKGDPRCQS